MKRIFQRALILFNGRIKFEKKYLENHTIKSDNNICVIEEKHNNQLLRI